MEKEDKLLSLVKKNHFSLNEGETIKVYIKGLPEYSNYEIIVYDIPLEHLSNKFYKLLHTVYRELHPLYIQQSVWAVSNENVNTIKRYILGCGGIVFSLQLIKEEEWEDALKGNANHKIKQYLMILRKLQDIRGVKKVDLKYVSDNLKKVAEIDETLFYEPLVDEIKSIRSKVLSLAGELILKYSSLHARTEEAEG